MNRGPKLKLKNVDKLKLKNIGWSGHYSLLSPGITENSGQQSKVVDTV